MAKNAYHASIEGAQHGAKSLEQFLINRFGRELYLLFFKSYTEKVWGVPCDQISAEWGAQRIKGLSITKAITHFVKSTVGKKKSGDLGQKGNALPPDGFAAFLEGLRARRFTEPEIDRMSKQNPARLLELRD